MEKNRRLLKLTIRLVDGHHRYISGHIFKVNAPQCDWIRPNASAIGNWNAVAADSVDYESGYDEKIKEGNIRESE